MIQQKLNDLFADSFKENWDLPALTDYATKETLTYAQLATEVAKLHLLFRQMGVKPGDKIARHFFCVCGHLRRGYSSDS
jgi:long-chain acyl-CoA synthetase